MPQRDRPSDHHPSSTPCDSKISERLTKLRWEFDVLSALRRAGAPYELTPGTLMDETLVSSGTITNRIDRLVAKGLVHRDGDPTDRRVVRVRLTPAGKDAVDSAMTLLLAFETEHIDAVDGKDRKALAHLLRGLLLPFER